MYYLCILHCKKILILEKRHYMYLWKLNDFIVVCHLERYIFIVADSKRTEKDTSGGYLEPIHVSKKTKRSSIRCNHVSEEETYGSKVLGEQCHGNKS